VNAGSTEKARDPLRSAEIPSAVGTQVEDHGLGYSNSVGGEEFCHELHDIAPLEAGGVVCEALQPKEGTRVLINAGSELEIRSWVIIGASITALWEKLSSGVRRSERFGLAFPDGRCVGELQLESAFRNREVSRDDVEGIRFLAIRQAAQKYVTRKGNIVARIDLRRRIGAHSLSEGVPRCTVVNRGE
jgi:hypothetical protein